VSSLLVISLAAAAVFAIAALGELLEQRAGILNVGLEGVMLLSGTFGFIAAKTSGSYLQGFTIAILTGALVGLLHGFFSITLGSNQVVNGMAIWILGFGLTTYIGYPYTGPLGLKPFPTLGGLPTFFVVALVLAVAIWFLLFKTHLGLELRSVGENPSVAEASGISVTGMRWQLSLYPELLFPNIFSRYIWRAMPFVITILVFILLSTRWFRLRWGATKPEALGIAYERQG
jgi:ABC-type uncharacterized transport system permease subunit